MSIPTGTYAVRYHVSQPSESNSFDTLFDLEIPIWGNSAQIAAMNAAAEAAMDACAASLAASFPSIQVNASRQYVCRVDGDPWPTS